MTFFKAWNQHRPNCHAWFYKYHVKVKIKHARWQYICCFEILIVTLLFKC